MSGTGIEPVSPAWKANMLTTTPTAQLAVISPLNLQHEIPITALPY